VARGIPREGRPALALLCTAQFMLVLDITAVFVAVPAMGADLGLSAGARGAVVGAYALALGLGLLPGGRLADARGRRRMFVAGMAVFGTASLACGLAPSAAVLIAARVGQGLGAAMIKPAALALLSQAFSGGERRAAAIAAWVSSASLAAASGALIGAAVVEAASWRWLFLVNVPVAAVAIAAARRVLPAHRPAAGVRPAGIRAALRSPGLLVAASVAALHCGVMLAVFGLLPLYLEGVLGMATIAAGAAVMAARLTAVGTSRPAARLIARWGLRRAMAGAMAAMAVAAAMLARVPARGSLVVDVLPGLLLFGAAIPLAFATVNALTLDAAPPGAEGAATGLMNTAQWLGGALGAAAASALAGPSDAAPAVLAAGVREGFAMCAVAAVAGCAVAAAAQAAATQAAGSRSARKAAAARMSGEVTPSAKPSSTSATAARASSVRPVARRTPASPRAARSSGIRAPWARATSRARRIARSAPSGSPSRSATSPPRRCSSAWWKKRPSRGITARASSSAARAASVSPTRRLASASRPR
jgi:MFS family permease